MKNALLSAYKKNEYKENAKVTFNEETGEFKIYSYLVIVPEVEDKELEISLEDAKKKFDQTKCTDAIEFSGIEWRHSRFHYGINHS